MINYFPIESGSNVLLQSPQSCCWRQGGIALSNIFRRLMSSNAAASLLLYLFVCFFLLTGSAQLSFGQRSIDDGKEALTNKAYPWYDAETDGTRSIEWGERASARSANRDEIPLAKSRVQKNRSGAAPPARGAGTPALPGFADSLLFGLSALTWGIVIALVLLVIGILIWAMMGMNSDEVRQDDAIPKRSMAESIKQLNFELDSPTGDFSHQAHAAYTDGDYRRAITYLFSHVLVTLDQKGLIRLRKGKTNRQYLNELRPHKPLANYYQQVMVPFEASFFGDHDLSKSDFEVCWDELGSFQASVEQVSRQAVTSQAGLSSQVANA